MPPPPTQYTRNGDTSLAYEVFGDPAAGAPLLMIMGLDFQMVWWPDGFCELLAAAGFAVVRFDNRDTGLSTHFDSPRTESPWKALAGGTKPAYTAADMLADALAVMDAVGWTSAHVMGASMGGAIAQGLALLHPERVRSLVSVMALPVTAGTLRTLGYIRFGFFRNFRGTGSAATPEEHVETLVTIHRALASPEFPFPEERSRAQAAISHARAPRDPRTTQRQLAAGRGQKYPPLSNVAVPTLVINGADDPIVKARGGRDTARRIPGAEYVEYPAMGHDLPEELWDDMVARVRALADRAG
ncbi:alpha/beta fold hydrolase [Actinomadura parmotrematis]|uniref:Alpha/beta fold hydrolase n=1 Tax=Actinomadura parmotrematis TaxID=2864039 RepID=A0ABS7FQ14_9ACTN|nr:alpha/beta hydrolase [Actinomadura parmotrematis]MBW8482320.1 alpha/beta fold hydrolase [Actinomadura parmotrematis]